MWRDVLRWLLTCIGAVAVLIGIVPLTPLIWLLVVFRVNVAPPFRLEFWQTQTIGAVLAAAGVALVFLAQRRPPAKPGGN
jgi:hypothetical protein